ncbi:hypothetical protein QBC44DRAFT_271076 [Cladorrhinum sp. PSN332]|nr:hypothetical protein QBC44DRAFT_271076 [Cladorrhinum sp. PSN332]
MADEPTLPALPKLRHHPFSEEGRKRPRAEHAPPSQLSTSSDPAFFSSDDDPALDNYEEHGRRKKRYVGTWFNQQPAFSSDSFMDEEMTNEPPVRLHSALAKRAKREFRKLDSGIYMSQSEDSFDASDDNDKRAPPKPAFSYTRLQPRPQSIAVGEKIARERINDCIERGRESVDLSDLGLESISDQTLDSINHIALIPIVDKDVAFEQKDPKIKLFLSNNRLTRFPPSLLNIEHLTDLSLRANNLTELPASITQLTNLRSLNIAQNQIRYLPSEFLQLLRKGGKLRSLQIQPNPLWLPQGWYDSRGKFDQRVREAKQYASLAGSAQPDDIKLESTWFGLTVTIHARSRVEFIDSARKVSGFRLPSTDRSLSKKEMEPFYRLRGPAELRKQTAGTSNIRVLNRKGASSLFEYALGVCARSSEADDLCQWLEREQEEGWPKGMLANLKDAINFSRKGLDLKCSMCGRRTVLPMTRWVEYYFINFTRVKVDKHTGENTTVRDPIIQQTQQTELYPFLRFGCSWMCVPPTIEKTGSQSESEDEGEGGASLVVDDAGEEGEEEDGDDEGEDTIIA